MPRSIAGTKDGIRRLNTTVNSSGDSFMVTLYNTMVYNEDAHSITLNNGGWVTPTTVSRIHQALRHRGHMNRINIKNGEMLCDGKPFINGTFVIVKGA